MPSPRPVTDADRNQIRALHAAGRSARQIAAAIGRHASVVSYHAKAMGLAFDRAQTRVATDAHVEDNRARRAALVEWQYRRSRTIAVRLDAATFQTAGNSQEGPVSAEFDFVPAKDELDLSRAITSYAKCAADLEKLDAGSDVAEDRSMLGDLLAKLRGQSAG